MALKKYLRYQKTTFASLISAVTIFWLSYGQLWRCAKLRGVVRPGYTET